MKTLTLQEIYVMRAKADALMTLAKTFNTVIELRAHLRDVCVYLERAENHAEHAQYEEAALECKNVFNALHRAKRNSTVGDVAYMGVIKLIADFNEG